MSQNNQQAKIEKVYLPEKSNNIIIKDRDIQNKYLLFNRFFINYNNGDTLLKGVPYARKFPKGRQDNSYDFIAKIAKDMDAVYQAFKFRKKFSFKPYKLAVGIGCESPSGSTALITLHPVYGIPFIPGTAIKGVVRNSYIQEKFSGNEADALADKEFVALFGFGAEDKEKAAQGKLVFLDAFPENHFEIHWDVQTPHFKDYYDIEREKQPTDDINPVPLYFPVVKNTSFSICICSLENICFDDKILEDAFTKYGIGAKTSLGYGLGEIHKVDCK